MKPKNKWFFAQFPTLCNKSCYIGFASGHLTKGYVCMDLGIIIELHTCSFSKLLPVSAPLLWHGALTMNIDNKWFYSLFPTLCNKSWEIAFKALSLSYGKHGGQNFGSIDLTKGLCLYWQGDGHKSGGAVTGRSNQARLSEAGGAPNTEPCIQQPNWEHWLWTRSAPHAAQAEREQQPAEWPLAPSLCKQWQPHSCRPF